MKKLKNKSIIATITLILMVTISAMIVAIPFATAQVEPSEKKTFAYIGAVPNPVGVGSDVLLHIGITDPLTVTTHKWRGLTVIVEKPDGTTETLGPFDTDSTGGTGGILTPDQVGTYRLYTHFPAQWYNTTWRGLGYVEIYYLESDSPVLELIVQQDPVPDYPGHSLPTEYWTRPIDAQLREWGQVAGSWLTAPENLYAPYNDGPETAHILWAKELEMGGWVGGEIPNTMENGDAYEGKFLNPVIINGILYYPNINTQNRGSVPIENLETVAVNLHTGEELWSKPLLDLNGVSQPLSFGQTFYWDGFNNHGTYTYLVTQVGRGVATMNFHDAYTGEWSFTIEDVPSGTNLFGPKGEIYRYTIDLNNGWMTLWNSSRTVQPQDTGTTRDGSWGRYLDTGDYPRIFPAERGIEWNITIPKLPGSTNAVWFEDRVVGSSATNEEFTLWAISLEPGKEGTVLYNTKWTPPAYFAEGRVNLFGFGGGWMLFSQEDRVGTYFIKETFEHYGFSLETGEYLWGPSEPQYYLDSLEDTPVQSRAIAYSKLYCLSVSGILYCYDIQTGELLWKYEVTDPYKEILWANTWWGKPLFVTDGKIYVGHYEHSSIDPRPRGAPMTCLDANTGDVIWRADGLFRSTRWGGRAVIADSIIATMDTYDQRVYAIGKGPSATTVNAGPKVTTWGSSVVIEGMVTDVSPGTDSAALKLRFPNGVPAIADEYMSDWMLYVYKQFECPMMLNGVTVKLETLDPNNNFYEVGTVTSDASGMYKIMWEPPVPGEYTIISTFQGSDAYYGSYAETAMGVTEAVSPAGSIEPEPTEAPLITTEIAVIVAAVIVAVALIAGFLIIRKRK